jgi:hypothetical protein
VKKIAQNYGNVLLKGNPPQKQSTKGVEFFRSKEGDSINDNIKTQ